MTLGPRTRFQSCVLWVALFAPIVLIAVYHAKVYFWLCDDAYISFRYSWNWIHGHGLVFNVGERVEGYTNFLWVILVGIAWKVVGIGPEVSSVAFSLAATVACYFLMARLIKQGPFGKVSLVPIGGACLLLALNRPFAVFTTSGLETRLVTALLLGGIALLGSEAVGMGGLILGSVMLGLCEYTRPEGLLLGSVVIAWRIFEDCRLGRNSLRRCLSVALPFVLLVGLHYGFRILYYGDWLPNTYYAKVIRPWPDAGLAYLALTLAENGLYVIVPLAMVGMLARWRMSGSTLPLLFLAIFVLHSLYVIRIGGDHFEFRPFDFFWPILFLCVVEGWAWIYYGFPNGEGSMGERREVRSPALVSLSVGLLFTATLAYMCILQVGSYAITYQLETRKETKFLIPEFSRENFPLAFLLPGMEKVTGVYNSASRFCRAKAIGTAQLEHKIFWRERRKQLALVALYAGQGVIPDSAVWTESAIGIPSFFFPRATIIDSLGLTDRTIARNPVEKPNSNRFMAHDRFPPAGYLESRGVNFNAGMIVTAIPETNPYYNHAYRIDEKHFLLFWSNDDKWVADHFRADRLKKFD